jgi:hypothetical protein
MPKSIDIVALFTKKLDHHIGRLEKKLDLLLKGQVALMATVAELQTSLDNITGLVATLQTDVAEVKADGDKLQIDVAALLDIIKNAPPGTIPDSLRDQAQAVEASLGSMKGGLDALDEQLRAIPTTPPPPASAQSKAPKS